MNRHPPLELRIRSTLLDTAISELATNVISVTKSSRLKKKGGLAFCSNRSQNKLENVHKQVLMVVLNDYSSSYSNPLDKVSKPILYVPD